jgi:hypothetical protein
MKQTTPAAIGNLCRLRIALIAEKAESFLICEVKGDRLVKQALNRLSPLIYLLH